MEEWPETLRDEQELDERLTRPWPRLVDFMRSLDGDILVLGAGGKVGPTLTRMARRAVRAAGVEKEVIAVGRRPLAGRQGEGVRAVLCDLLDPEAVARLPRAANVLFLAGRKFGSTGDEPATWAANVMVPHNAARTFTRSRICVFSTGCVYPLMDVAEGGATEETPVDPVGEYAMSCLGRERIFDYFSRTAGERVVHLRLNWAVEMRYGVLADVATKVWRGEAVDVTTGYANVIWQGDACNYALLALGAASSPADILNITGPETISIRETAEAFARMFAREAVITGEENGRAYLSDASRSHERFGPPLVPPGPILRWTADWVRRGGPNLGKPTHFEVQDGKF